jgi:hypothetical protein
MKDERSGVRTITLELLRHGRASNQLLSSLTQYLALCGNHPATTTHMPFEHRQLLIRLRSLAYKDSLRTREMQLQDTADTMADLLGGLPGLISELAERPRDQIALTHLRLILSASELALLPFELANAPVGFPGAGQSLALQSQVPLCITREVRRVSLHRLDWPTKPKILFIAARPPQVGMIPLEAHLLALRRVVDPWVRHADDPAEQRKNLEEHLVFLPRASADEIHAACVQGGFSYIHILAHGVQDREREDGPFGLALHHSRNPNEKHIVDGPTLAAMLRVRTDEDRFVRPTVVSIASCDSGNVGSVVGAGSSIAHALHEDGIPLVIGAQFPLSFAASVILTEVLYGGLLKGSDPRLLLNDLRQQLKSRVPGTHDWASLVAYASLSGLEPQLGEIRLKRAQERTDAALAQADDLARRVEERANPQESDEEVRKSLDLLDKSLDRVKEGRRHLRDILGDPYSDNAQQRCQIYGLLASTEKREAEILFQLRWIRYGAAGIQAYPVESRDALRRARFLYDRAFLEDRSSAWPVVQYLSLTAILDGVRPENQRDFRGRWTLARVLSEEDQFSEDRRQAVWAHGNLIELYLLSLLLKPSGDVPNPEEAVDTAKEHARRLVRSAGRSSFEFFSTWRQIVRYQEWFNRLIAIHTPSDPLVNAAETIRDELESAPYFGRTAIER